MFGYFIKIPIFQFRNPKENKFRFFTKELRFLDQNAIFMFLLKFYFSSNRRVDTLRAFFAPTDGLLLAFHFVDQNHIIILTVVIFLSRQWVHVHCVFWLICTVFYAVQFVQTICIIIFFLMIRNFSLFACGFKQQIFLFSSFVSSMCHSLTRGT